MKETTKLIQVKENKCLCYKVSFVIFLSRMWCKNSQKIKGQLRRTDAVLFKCLSTVIAAYIDLWTYYSELWLTFFGFSHGSYFTLQRTAETLSRKHTFLIKGRVSFLEGLEFLKFDKMFLSVICAKFVLTEYRIIERAFYLLLLSH